MTTMAGSGIYSYIEARAVTCPNCEFTDVTDVYVNDHREASFTCERCGHEHRDHINDL